MHYHGSGILLAGVWRKKGWLSLAVPQLNSILRYFPLSLSTNSCTIIDWRWIRRRFRVRNYDELPLANFVLLGSPVRRVAKPRHCRSLARETCMYESFLRETGTRVRWYIGVPMLGTFLRQRLSSHSRHWRAIQCSTWATKQLKSRGWAKKDYPDDDDAQNKDDDGEQAADDDDDDQSLADNDPTTYFTASTFTATEDD